MQITALMHAVQASNTGDAFAPGLSPVQWVGLAPYLLRRELHAGELLIRQGDVERAAYLVEQGNLQVFVSGARRRSSPRVAVLRPGALVGEPSLFAAVPRAANVEAMTPAVVWTLDPARLDAMCLRAPELALAVLRSAGAVLVVRHRDNAARGVPLA
ncbi:MAG: cyclic nucleotide-binding domain-containing protein [Rubrivivax sp.]